MSMYCCHCMTPLENGANQCPVCGKDQTSPVPAHHLLPGTMLNGKFYIGEALGEGGFGITYIGRDVKLDMKVAIKEFYPNGYVNRNNAASSRVNDIVSGDRRDFFEKGRERFLKEARILAKFSGEPGVVDVRDFFEENNTAYIIMEYLDGVDLKTYLKKKGTLTPEHTVELLMPVMNSLKKVHAQDLIHRDISPDNIMVVGNRVKLLDFGAARTVSAEANKSLSVMLKPGYAPEEQYRSKGNQGPWTDIYALCATMYKCMTGITPDDATQRVYSDEVKTPSALNVAIKPEVERAIMRGMSVHQTDRYQCIEDLIKGLQGIDVAFTGSDRTIAVGKNVAYDDEATVYMPPEDQDEKTVLGNDVQPYTPQEKPRKEPPKMEFTPSTNTGSTPRTTPNTMSTPQKAKSNKWLFIGIAAAVLLAILIPLLISFFGDGEDVDTPDTPNDNQTSNVGNNDSDEIDEEVTMSDELFDFTFTLEGEVYKLPCKYETLTNNGWTISSSGYTSDTKIAGDDYEAFYMVKDGRKVTVYSYNYSGNAKPIKDCLIGGIECEAYYEVDFSIALGITVHDNVETIKEAFGVPGYSNTGDSYQSLTYYAVKDSNYNFVKFYITDDGEYSSIEMRNFLKTSADETTTSTERPAYLDDYVTPDTMGENLKSAVLDIGGDLYQLPAPVSAFLENGWEVTQQSGDVVAGGTDYICVERDGCEMQLSVINYAEYQTTVENCAVYKVSVDSDDLTTVAVGSENNPITFGCTKDDVDAAIDNQFYTYEGTYSYSYSYSEYKERDFSLSISVDVETNEVSTISISCKTWDYE